MLSMLKNEHIVDAPECFVYGMSQIIKQETMCNGEVINNIHKVINNSELKDDIFEQEAIK